MIRQQIDYKGIRENWEEVNSTGKLGVGKFHFGVTGGGI